ncbi:tetratricopeptide repeat protein [Marinicella sp. S1101]|uniref:tetratricopeptide repeat-containing sulfotransferase family protein n=1 Tax=Marinicella marina TaxID=2996016 RepID=UPI0022609F63|nr:tetratricopeptide repeat-containing sulfotransferase family protein [Marinicella marina]MCX7554345.1 tetratricopeptide repeat protein [Marinicella marina]MDJ1138664.1 tetratricopeptide repeat protein [Marinicella marina]
MTDNINNAQELFRTGEIQEALNLLATDSSDQAISLLREYHLGEGQTELAKPYIEQLATKASAEGLVSQSIQAFLKHDFNQAIQLAEMAVQSNPQSATAHNHLGRALQNAGQSGRASKAFKSAVRLDEDYAQGWHNLAHTRRAIGALDEAIGFYQKAITAAKSYQSAYFNLGVTLAAMERHDEALSTFKKLIKINPTHALAWVNAGLAHHAKGDFKSAINCYDQAMDIAPKMALPFTYKGILLNELQETEQAIKCLKHALSLDANEIDAWCELTNLYEKTNDLKQAAAANQQAQQLDSTHPTVMIDAARIARRQKNTEQALDYLNTIEVSQLPFRKAVEYWFERATILDQDGQFNAAFASYQQANQLAAQSPRNKQFNPDALDKRLATIDAGLDHIKTPSKPGIFSRLFGARDYAPNTAKRELGSHLCFLIGFPRSGTTLIDTILSANNDVTSIEEMPTIETVIKYLSENKQNPWWPDFKNKADWPVLRSLYFDQIDSHLDQGQPQLVIDKLPFRFLQALFIKDLFPQARFLFMARQPADVILSNFMQNYAPNETFIHFNAFDETVNTYDRSMQLWYRIREHLGTQLMTVKYEDLVTSPEQTTQDACQFLGIDYKADMLNTQKRLASRARVSTNSYAQVAEDLYQKSVNRWQHYRQAFEPHKALLEQHRKALKY